MSKPIHAAQYRLTGPTAGMRMLRHVQGRQLWDMRIWLTYHPDHAPVDIVDGQPRKREGELQHFRTPVPCLPSELVAHYDRAIAELCEGTPVVIAAGFDAYLLPKQPAPTKPQRTPRPAPIDHHEPLAVTG